MKSTKIKKKKNDILLEIRIKSILIDSFYGLEWKIWHVKIPICLIAREIILTKQICISLVVSVGTCLRILSKFIRE